MDRPCYCCDNLLIDPGTKENVNDIDGALSGLGMLSVNTESRKQYLQEIVRQDDAIESNLSTVQGGFCVFHMNKKFVTDLVTTMPTMLSALNKGNANATSLNYLNGHQLPIYTTQKASFKLKSSRRTRFHKPYELPWHHKMEERARTSNWIQENDIACIVADEAASSSSSSSSAGNRSNPGSPSKPGRVSSGSGLLRSRSLDDLTCPAWESEETSTQAVQPREEIENVSQQMRDLTVN